MSETTETNIPATESPVEGVQIKTVVNLRDILSMLRNGYVKFPGDNHYDPEKKNSILDHYSLTMDQARALMSIPQLKNFRVVMPKPKPTIELPFTLNVDVTEEEVKNWGKKSKSAEKSFC